MTDYMVHHPVKSQAINNRRNLRTVLEKDISYKMPMIGILSHMQPKYEI